MERGLNLQSDILKVGHHGSKTSSSPEFLSKVLPDAAVISVGEKNRFGHPSSLTINRLAEMGIEVFRTDRYGNIEIETNGRNYILSGK